MTCTISECLLQLPRVIQNTYFQLNPRNPTNSEDHFQELLRHNLSLLGYRVASEISYQKVARDLHGEPLPLKNKTERFDLTIDALNLLFELKHTTDLDESASHQLWNYMDHSDYEYGIVINFTKPNKKQKYRASTRVYQKHAEKSFTDSYGFTYTRNTYPLMESYESQDYMEAFLMKT